MLKTGAPNILHAPPILILIGLRGVGKTTIGRGLAARLGCAFINLDDITPHEWGAADESAISDYFASEGEPKFREAETRALKNILAVRLPPFVLALGGGTPMAPGAEALLRHAREEAGAKVVLLEASIELLRKRLSAGAEPHRPSLTGKPVADELADLWRTREPVFRRIADITIRTDHRTPDEIVKAVITGVSSAG